VTFQNDTQRVIDQVALAYRAGCWRTQPPDQLHARDTTMTCPRISAVRHMKKRGSRASTMKRLKGRLERLDLGAIDSGLLLCVPVHLRRDDSEPGNSRGSSYSVAKGSMNSAERSVDMNPLTNRIPILEPEDAPAEVRSVYVDFQRRMGFPAAPNFIKAQGHSLAVSRGT